VQLFPQYYLACEADYWYHDAAGSYSSCAGPDSVTTTPTDLSNNTATKISPAAAGLNGTYNTRLLANEAARLVTEHDVTTPFFMYLAFMAVHDGCTSKTSPFSGLGKQAPLATVDLYNTTVLDTYKVAGAMYTELDSGVQTVIDALQANGMWDSTVLIFVSDSECAWPALSSGSWIIYRRVSS
jgi:arylsulfatase A-like enzyme